MNPSRLLLTLAAIATVATTTAYLLAGAHIGGT